MACAFSNISLAQTSPSTSQNKDQEEASLSQSEIIQISDNMKALADKAKTLKGERLSIIQLEIYNMNEKLRNELRNAVEKSRRITSF